MVEWIDSCHQANWQEYCEVKPVKCVSVGIMREYPDHINIIQSKSDGNQVDAVLSIPRCSIKRIRKLGVKDAS